MALYGLLEKSADTDLLREMIGFAAERLMELEVARRTWRAHPPPSAKMLLINGNWADPFQQWLGGLINHSSAHEPQLSQGSGSSSSRPTAPT
ncbi:hypothetical protein [Pararhodospirillum photometricum]|uniref:hypothetical protein n=1 Tax=Pararhodospirillum photometricum TaxID=1084 RepID=UPI00031D70B9